MISSNGVGIFNTTEPNLSKQMITPSIHTEKRIERQYDLDLIIAI